MIIQRVSLFKRIFIFSLLTFLLTTGFQSAPADSTTAVQSVNTFLNIGQFGALLYLLWRSDSALMRQRNEQADERRWLINLLMVALKVKAPTDEK